MEPVIGELYRAFGSYQLDADFSGCSHCIDPHDTERLTVAELATLSVDDLSHYAFDAMTTWGEVRHFKYFLPRLFELALFDFDEFTSAEVLFGKLTLGEWEAWPDQERRAVDAYLRVFWNSVHTKEIDWSVEDDSVDTALCAVGKAAQSMNPFLEQWTASEEAASVNHLAQFVLLNIHSIRNHDTLWNAFWEDRNTQACETLDWLKHPATYEYLYDREELLHPRLACAINELAFAKSPPPSSR